MRPRLHESQQPKCRGKPSVLGEVGGGRADDGWIGGWVHGWVEILTPHLPVLVILGKNYLISEFSSFFLKMKIITVTSNGCCED